MNEKTELLLEIIFLCVASTFTLIASLTFIIYVIVKTLLQDCRLQEKLFPSKTYRYTKEPFFNMHTRFQLSLQFSILFTVICDLYIVFYRPNEGDDFFWMCQLQAIQMQLCNWLVFMYSAAIAFWIMIFICFVQKWRVVEARTQRVYEIITHVICWAVALLFTGLPFINHTYGKAGNWCWISKATETGKWMQLATYYIPLWIILPIVAFMYGATLVVVWRSHRAVQKYLATNHELSSVRKEIFSVGKELSITTKQVINEWKISAKFILWPAIFLAIWIVPTVNRLIQIITGKSYFWLTLAHLTITQLYGLCVVLVYFLNPLGHIVILRKLICCEYCRTFGESEADDYRRLQ